MRFQYDDYPFYLREIDATGAPVLKDLSRFYQRMTILYNLWFSPEAFFEVKNVVDSRGVWHGVEIVAKRTCSYRQMRERLWGFLYPVSVTMCDLLRSKDYCSLLPISQVKYILVGPLSHLQHQHGAECRFSHRLGKRADIWTFSGGAFAPGRSLTPEEDLFTTRLLADCPKDPMTDKVYREGWVVGERVVADYGGDSPLPFEAEFDCFCLTCERNLRLAASKLLTLTPL